jgi:hypothetical protein
MYVCKYITLTCYDVAALRFVTIMDLNCGAMESSFDSLHIQKIGPHVLLYVYLNGGGAMYVCMYVSMYDFIFIDVCIYCMYVCMYVMAEQKTLRILVRVRVVWRSPRSVLLLCCQGWRPE